MSKRYKLSKLFTVSKKMNSSNKNQNIWNFHTFLKCVVQHLDHLTLRIPLDPVPKGQFPKMD